ncbi:hypothetical protein PTB13_15675, partial [Bacillus sp. MHSD17]|nr:hypothetical protein [Bacillus sp. MHSD17]
AAYICLPKTAWPPTFIGGEKKTSIETEDVEFFGENELPNLSVARNTEEQIREMFAYMKEPQKETLID